MDVNQLKNSGVDGIALQVTKPARRAGLVEETADGDAIRLASVRVFAFNDLLLVADCDQVNAEALVELVTTAAQDTGSIYRGLDASVQIAGNGYQVQLPPAEDAGFQRGDQVAAVTALGILFIGPPNATRLATDLAEIRNQQVG